jgi:pimeloyl-ACP methyl ester carboxylesterase
LYAADLNPQATRAECVKEDAHTLRHTICKGFPLGFDERAPGARASRTYGGWCWRRVYDRLTAKGHYVVAPTLSGVGERSHLKADDIDLATQIQDVVGEIKWKDLDNLILVGHSYGGMVITGAAEQLRDRISAIVYVDAFLPADGQSLADLSGRASWPDHVTPPLAASVFHVNAKDAAWVDSKTTPHPTQCFTQKLKVTGAYQTIAKNSTSEHRYSRLTPSTRRLNSAGQTGVGRPQRSPAATT